MDTKRSYKYKLESIKDEINHLKGEQGKPLIKGSKKTGNKITSPEHRI